MTSRSSTAAGQSDYPDGLGHESVGVVEEVLPGSLFQKGDRVVIFQGDHCGHCHACLNALSSTYCASHTFPPKPGQTRVGMAGIQDINESESGGWAMAQYRIAHEANVVRIPDSLDFKYAQAANCSVGVGWSNQEMMDVRPGSTVLVTGVGFITMGHVIAALHRNCTIIALVRNQYREDVLRKMGVEHFINPNDEDWQEKVRALTYNGQGVDYAIDGSGHPSYQEKCLQATVPSVIPGLRELDKRGDGFGDGKDARELFADGGPVQSFKLISYWNRLKIDKSVDFVVTCHCEKGCEGFLASITVSMRKENFNLHGDGILGRKLSSKNLEEVPNSKDYYPVVEMIPMVCRQGQS